MLGRVLFYSIIFFAVLCALAPALLISATDSSPIVTRQEISALNQADSLSPLLRQLTQVRRYSNQTHQVFVSKQQIDSAVAIVHRAKMPLALRVTASDRLGIVEGSLALPQWLNHRFFNVVIHFKQGQILDIEKLKLGWLSFDGSLALSWFATVLDWYTNSELGGLLVRSAAFTTISPRGAELTVYPVKKLLDTLKSIEWSQPSEDELYVQQRVSYYIDLLNDLHQNIGLKQNSLHPYIQFVFLHTDNQQDSYMRALDKRSALMSLAIFTGHPRIAIAIGFPELVQKSMAPLTLGNRRDLAQHFVISAVLHAVSTSNLAYAIGELKELMDRSRGGSGYSFADLAADIAGIRFAQHVLDNEIGELTSENDYFPKISDLNEGLSKAEFDRAYENIQSEKYDEQVNLIEKRIAQLPLYRSK